MAFLLVLPKLPGQVRIFVSISFFRKKNLHWLWIFNYFIFFVYLFFLEKILHWLWIFNYYIFLYFLCTDIHVSACAPQHMCGGQRIASGPWYSLSPFRSCWSNLVIKMASKHRLPTSPGLVNLPFNLPKFFSISCGLESLKIKLELCQHSHTDILNECCKYSLSWRERFEFYRSTENTVTLGPVSRYLYFEYFLCLITYTLYIILTLL